MTQEIIISVANVAQGLLSSKLGENHMIMVVLTPDDNGEATKIQVSTDIDREYAAWALRSAADNILKGGEPSATH